MNSRPKWRRSSNIKPVRYANLELALEKPRESRAPDHGTKIPMGSSSQASGRETNRLEGPQRSKSQLQIQRETPKGSFEFTPSATSSNVTKKNLGKDTRKLQDKEFQKEASVFVTNYFQVNCPEVLYDGVKINPMTRKLFVDMLNHLLETLTIMDKDKPIDLTLSNYESELPQWLKMLEYPGQINKSLLQTVSVPQNWAYILGLMYWLTKILVVGNMFTTDALFNPNSEDKDEVWQVLCLQYSLQSFNLYTGKEEEQYEMICDEAINKYREIYGISRNTLEALVAEVEQLQEELEASNGQADKDAYDETEQRWLVMQSLSAKYDEEMIKIKAENEDFKAKIMKNQRNGSSLKLDMEQAEREIKDLNCIIEMQDMSVTELAEIQKKSEYLEKDISYLEKECEVYQSLITRNDHESATKRDKILQNMHSFNRGIIQLEQLIPELRDFHIRAEPEDENILIDMENTCRSLEVLKNSNLSKVEALANQMQEAQRLSERKKQHLQELIDICTGLKRKIELKRTENENLEWSLEEKEKLHKAESEEWDEKLNLAQEKLKELKDMQKGKIILEENLTRRLEESPDGSSGCHQTVLGKGAAGGETYTGGVAQMKKAMKDQDEIFKESYEKQIRDIEKD